MLKVKTILIALIHLFISTTTTATHSIGWNSGDAWRAPKAGYGEGYVFRRPQNAPICTYMLMLWTIWCLKFWNMTKS